jgi:alkanesulfonate monooxygenase SsuD/methylene tetrahydromethanopterin reductase-like flavin-dependent oxidoreductase (luciferase family)
VFGPGLSQPIEGGIWQKEGHPGREVVIVGDRIVVAEHLRTVADDGRGYGVSVLRESYPQSWEDKFVKETFRKLDALHANLM